MLRHNAKITEMQSLIWLALICHLGAFVFSNCMCLVNARTQSGAGTSFKPEVWSA